MNAKEKCVVVPLTQQQYDVVTAIAKERKTTIENIILKSLDTKLRHYEDNAYRGKMAEARAKTQHAGMCCGRGTG